MSQWMQIAAELNQLINFGQLPFQSEQPRRSMLPPRHGDLRNIAWWVFSDDETEAKASYDCWLVIKKEEYFEKLYGHDDDDDESSQWWRSCYRRSSVVIFFILMLTGYRRNISAEVVAAEGKWEQKLRDRCFLNVLRPAQFIQACSAIHGGSWEGNTGMLHHCIEALSGMLDCAAQTFSLSHTPVSGTTDTHTLEYAGKQLAMLCAEAMFSAGTCMHPLA